MTKTLALLCLVVLVGPPAAEPRVRASLDERILGGLNAERAAHGRPRLEPNARLAAAARAHSLEMVVDGYFAHDSFDGTAFWKRIRRFYGRWSVGEVLLEASPGVSARRAIAMWMASGEHRANVLDPLWRDVGVSAVHVPAAPGFFAGAPVTVVTADFGRRDAG